MPKKKTNAAAAGKKTASTDSGRKKSTSSGSRSKKGSAESAAKKPSKAVAAARQPKISTEYDTSIPAYIPVGLASLLLFILMLIVALRPEGFLPSFIHETVTGLIGYAGFYFLIPSLLYIGIVNLWGGFQQKQSRSLCTLAFVLFAGSIYHLAVQTQGIASGLDLFPDLYQGGMDGRGGGILCGGLAVFLRWACGTVVSYIVIGSGAVLTLLGAMELTIPSLIRAIRGRPRDDWEDEEQEEVYVEPAVKLVNRIAEKQIENKHRKKQRQSAEELPETGDEDIEEVFLLRDTGEQAAPAPSSGKRRKAAEKPQFEQLSIASAQSEGKMLTPDDPIPAAPEKAAPPASVPAPEPAPKADSGRKIGAPENAHSIFRAVRDFDTDDSRPSAGISVPAPENEEAEIFSGSMEEGMPFDEEPAEAFTEESDNEPDDFFPEEIPAFTPPPVPAAIPKAARKVPVSVAKPVDRKAAVSPAPELPPDKVTHQDTRAAAAEVSAEIAETESRTPLQAYCYPPIELLNLPTGSKSDGIDEIRDNTERLNKALASFHIDAKITDVTRGPSVTRYEVRLSEGVKLSKLVNCADDIALNLGASGVRIAAIAGKISIVGIEVPNKSVTMVSLREVIDSDKFRSARSNTSFSVGKNISGECVVGNISKMPHMLIAGTTGSGKSVCMNSIIISLLYKSAPEDVKLIMVDPKMVELGIYNEIPHLLIPVVTDPKKAAGSLQWAVNEMLRRYKMMSEAGVRDLSTYNKEVGEDGKLPSIVIIIDELADLMLVAAKEVEDSICRIAQMGRAAGMHLIIATQRPSADVITGLMKANIPSRIAFSVASAMESRIILDTMGAEKLVGKGDMLYAPIGEGKPLRVQGCFVTDAEVERVTRFVKQNSKAAYDPKVQADVDRAAQNAGKSGKSQTIAADSDFEAADGESEHDEMLPEAVDVILSTGQASVSMLQRRLKLGYARASRIVDQMEELGLVGPFQGSKPRAILVTKEQWAAMRGGDSPAGEAGEFENM